MEVPRIKITGRPISKKRAYKRGKKNTFYLSQRYKTWKKEALWQLKKYKKKYTGYVKIRYFFEVKGRARFDLDNAVVGINDLLEDAEIINNDKNVLKIEAEKQYERDDFVTYVWIEPIDEII